MAPPNTTSFEVLILQAGGSTSPTVLQALRDKKFAPRLTADLQAASGLLKKMTEPILVIEAGENPEKTKELLARLEPLSKTLAVPVVLAGTDVEQFERGLDKLFPAATTLNTPYVAVEMLAAINYLSRTIKQRRGKVTPAKDDAEVLQPISSRSISQEPGTTIPEAVFAQLQKLGLVGKSIGGEPLSGSSIDLDLLRENQMLPTRPAVKESADQILSEAGEWGREHLLRVAFVTQRIVGALKPDPVLAEALRSATFLYALSFGKGRPELFRQVLPVGGMKDKDGARISQGGFRGEVASKINESAAAVLKNLSLDRESQIIAMMARLVAGEVKPADDDLSVVASALMAADTSDRLFFANGSWSPRRAYGLLGRLKRGDELDFHPIVACCMVKILAEAIASRTPMFLLPKELRTNKELQAELMNQARRPVAIHEKKVALAALSPGMKLSQSLIGVDGSEVLARDIQLDQDLIWRIWQLSAVRPLRSAIVFKPTDLGE